MKQSNKKPWTRVGKLESKVRHLETQINQSRDMHKIDFEELTARIQGNNEAIGYFKEVVEPQVDKLVDLIDHLKVHFEEF